MIRLKKNGYVACNSKTEKRYKSPLFLTQKGVETAKGIVEKIDRIVESAGEGVTQKNREIFYETLQIISTNLQRMCDKYGEEL